MIVAVFIVLTIFQCLLSPFVKAEILYDQDGIQFQASFRVTHYNAYTCDVPEDRVPEKKYEQIKDNHGQPIHIWEASYSVYNSTPKGLDYLRAFVAIESNWPPCHSWTANPDLRILEPIEWAGLWGLIQMPNGMRPLQAVQEEKYLLVFHNEQPRIDRWDINYTFDDDPTPGGSRQTRWEPPPPQPQLPDSQPAPAPRSAPEPAPTVPARDLCEETPPGTQCWLKLSNQPGCYVWNLYPWSAVTWTGECAEGLAHGTGTLKFTWDGGKESTEDTGHLQEGQRHGQWVERSSIGHVAEGPYSEGKRAGQWVFRYPDGKVSEGPYVEGKSHGQWVVRSANGTVEEGPFVEGKRHGRWVERFANGTVAEGPYVEGKSHGQWVVRSANGTVEEGPYVEGKRHGQWVVRDRTGAVAKGTYVKGKGPGRVDAFDRSGKVVGYAVMEDVD